MVVVVGAVAVRGATSPVTALGLNGFVVLLASPVSWSHHWGWVVLFLVSPHWWWDADDGTTVASFVVGNAYTWCALAVLAVAAFRSADREFGRARVDVDHRAVA